MYKGQVIHHRDNRESVHNHTTILYSFNHTLPVTGKQIQRPTTFKMLKAFVLALAAATLSNAAPASGSTLPTVEITVVDRSDWLNVLNTTICGTLGTLITDPALDHVSELYLSSVEVVPLETVTCTPYLYTDGTGRRGLPFFEDNPGLLSTNTVRVGSIYCSSSQLSYAA